MVLTERGSWLISLGTESKDTITINTRKSGLNFACCNGTGDLRVWY